MKFSELSKGQIDNIADFRPYWLAENFPHVMINYRPVFMIHIHFNWTKANYPQILENYGSPSHIENRPFPSEPYTMEDELPGMILGIIDSVMYENPDLIVK